MEDVEGVRGEGHGDDVVVIAPEQLPSEIAEQLDWIGRQREAANLKLGEACEDLVQAKQAVHDAERLLSDLAHDERLIRRTVEICLRATSSSPVATADVATMQGQNEAKATAPATPPRRRRSPTEIRLEVFGALSILNGVPQHLSVRTLMDITSAAKSTVEGALAHYQKLGQVEEVASGTWRKRLPDPAAAVTEAASSGDFAAEAQPLRVHHQEPKTDAEIIDFVLSCGVAGTTETQMSLVGASPAQIDRLVENGDLLWSSDDHFYRVPEPVVTDEAAS